MTQPTFSDGPRRGIVIPAMGSKTHEDDERPLLAAMMLAAAAWGPFLIFDTPPARALEALQLERLGEYHVLLSFLGVALPAGYLLHFGARRAAPLEALLARVVSAWKYLMPLLILGLSWSVASIGLRQAFSPNLGELTADRAATEATSSFYATVRGRVLEEPAAVTQKSGLYYYVPLRGSDGAGAPLRLVVAGYERELQKLGVLEPSAAEVTVSGLVDEEVRRDDVVELARQFRQPTPERIRALRPKIQYGDRAPLYFSGAMLAGGFGFAAFVFLRERKRAERDREPK